MKKKLGMILAVLFCLGLALPARAQLVIIAHPSVKANEITRNDLREIFTGAVTTLPDGNRVIPILLKAGTEYEEFLHLFIGKSDTEFRAGWRALVFSGRTTMPLRLEPDAVVVDFVAHHAGAIGFIRADTLRDGVKVLTVR